MTPAKIVQLSITIGGIALAALVFFFGPYEMMGNTFLAMAILLVAGVAAGFAYAKLYGRRKF
jgi:hypothetical protein